MKAKFKINRLSPIGETGTSIEKFLYETPRARKNKYGVCVCHQNGEIFVLLTFASTFEEAFRIAKSAYQASPYPQVGVDHFVVHGICKNSTCRGGGEWRTKTFLVDWSTSG